MSVAIMYRNDELSLTMSWVGCLLKDSEFFVLFTENSQILHKIFDTPILKQITQLIVELNSSLGHIIVTVVCRQMFTKQCIGYKQTGLEKIDFHINFLSYINDESDVFTNLFH